MHFLDLIIYLISICIIWWVLEKISDGELTNELGGVIGIIILAIYSIIYFIVFAIIDYNMVEVIPSVYDSLKL